MLIVLNPGESLTAVMSGAADSVDPTYAVTWTEGESLSQPVGSLSGATAVTLASAGTAAREVNNISIYNGDTAAVTVTVSKVVGGTSYPLFVRTLAVGAVLQMDADGLGVFESSTSVSGAGAVAGSGVTASEQAIGHVQRTVLTLLGVEITVANTTGVSFGGVKIYDFPEGRILVLGSLLSGVTVGLTNAGNATPIDAADGGDMALGSTEPDDGTIGGTDVDLCPSTSIDPISDGIAGAALAAAAQFDGTTTPLDMYLNMLIDDADVADAASDVLEISGRVEITWVNLGDY